jgi:hypothetical protein
MILFGRRKGEAQHRPGGEQGRGRHILMWSALENRVSKLEKVAESKQGTKICNCRVQTRYHNAACLDAILKGISRVCPVHGFRDLGFFFWHSKQYPLGLGDDQFCPCPPEPWRSWVLRKGPDPRIGEQPAREGVQPDSVLSFEEDRRRTGSILAEYSTARQQWLDSSGRELPSRQELVKLQWKRARQHAGQTRSASL